MAGRLLKSSAVLAALAFAALMSSQARACDPPQGSCCMDSAGWVTCAGECIDLNGAGTLCKVWDHPPPDYWGDSRTKPLSLSALRRKYPEIWRNMQARGSKGTVKFDAR
jgi:hypothetical protein